MLHLEVPKNYSRVLRTFDVDLETKGGGKMVREKKNTGVREPSIRENMSHLDGVFEFQKFSDKEVINIHVKSSQYSTVVWTQTRSETQEWLFQDQFNIKRKLPNDGKLTKTLYTFVLQNEEPT